MKTKTFIDLHLALRENIEELQNGTIVPGTDYASVLLSAAAITLAAAITEAAEARAEKPRE